MPVNWRRVRLPMTSGLRASSLARVHTNRRSSWTDATDGGPTAANCTDRQGLLQGRRAVRTDCDRRLVDDFADAWTRDEDERSIQGIRRGHRQGVATVDRRSRAHSHFDLIAINVFPRASLPSARGERRYRSPGPRQPTNNDFDLYGEDSRIESVEDRAAYRAWLDTVVKRKAPTEPPASVRERLQSILVATALRFERRARIFREVHPLALQVILSSGVLNGILVSRSVDSCADLIRSLIRNSLDLELVVDDLNYRLVEKSTGSTVRVISQHQLLKNAFATFYGQDSALGNASDMFMLRV